MLTLSRKAVCTSLQIIQRSHSVLPLSVLCTWCLVVSSAKRFSLLLQVLLVGGERKLSESDSENYAARPTNARSPVKTYSNSCTFIF